MAAASLLGFTSNLEHAVDGWASFALRDYRGMDDKAAILADVCTALSGNQPDKAGAILRERYPFVPLANVGRRYSVR
jgi:hypothetical protein